MAIFLNTALICIFYYIIGQSHSNLKNNFSNYCIKIINGSIILSFIALLSNFFLGLNLLLNSCVFLALIFYAFYKQSYKIIFNKTNINSRFGTVSIIQYLQAISNNYITMTNGLCMYSKSPCTNENISKLLKMKKKFSYKVYYF